MEEVLTRLKTLEDMISSVDKKVTVLLLANDGIKIPVQIVKPPSATGNKNKRWSLVEEDKLIGELKERKTFTEIATEHGRTRNAIVARTNDIIDRMTALGKSTTDICDTLSLDEKYVKGHLDKDAAAISKLDATKVAAQPISPAFLDNVDVSTLSDTLAASDAYDGPGEARAQLTDLAPFTPYHSKNLRNARQVSQLRAGLARPSDVTMKEDYDFTIH